MFRCIQVVEEPQKPLEFIENGGQASNFKFYKKMFSTTRKITAVNLGKISFLKQLSIRKKHIYKL